MDILNPAELNRACRKFPQARGWIERWRLVAEAAVWKSLVDVRLMFPSADGIPIGRGRNRLIITCFNVGGNDFRLLTRINYELGLIQVESVLTHAEYSKNDWKRKYE